MAGNKDDCHKSKIGNIGKALLKKAGSLIAKFLCQQLQNLAGTARAVIQAQLAIVEPILELEAVFVENFVVFPLNAAVKTTDSVSKGMSKPLTEAGIDKSCKTHKKVHTQLEAATAPVKATGRTLKSMRDAAQAEVERGRKRVQAMKDAIAALDDLFNIECP